MINFKIFAFLIFIASLSIPTLAKELPLASFAKLPTVSNLKLAPDGKNFAYISVIKGRKSLVVRNIETGQFNIVPPIDKSDIAIFWWGNNSRLLIGYEMTTKVRGSSVMRQETRLLAIDHDMKNPKWIVRPADEKGEGSWIANRKKYPPAQFQTDIIDLLPKDPNFILLALDGDFDAQDEVRKININTGAYTIVNDGVRGIQYWATNSDHEVSYGYGYDRLKGKYISKLRLPNGNWIDLSKQTYLERFDFIVFDEDPSYAYMSGHVKNDTTGLYKINIATGQITETLFEHNSVDADSLLMHPYTRKPVGYAYTTDFNQYVYFDKEFNRIQKIAQKALKMDNIRIVDKVQGQQIYILFASNDRQPGVYYYYNRPAKHLSMISPIRPDIKPEEMASVKEVMIPVSDGSSIPAFLTLPRGKTENLKTIVFPHGGPQSRDTAHWEFTAQFLANRGYAVLQPNFRGSSGYGYRYQRMGNNQWGGLMQQDVTDATKWLIDNKIAQKDKICIAGYSYGGYAALMGIIQNSALYQCAASINGVTDIPKMKLNDKKFIGGSSWIKTMGLEGANDKTVSPYHLYKKIQVPVLLISSKDDARINYQWTRQLSKKLRKKSTFVLIEDGGHHMDTVNARMTVLTELEKFFKKHLK
ncbi:prolyl oligopeptidase family serine peptidase [Temperatibacter marinus]|uniref:Prolyl oligopeptidase family serine peptidase n=1 Tax=Temperatibacter marinus TaxID=1456591 RepID=A0AA52H9C9_9PROT|nr:prolyl oligopeptidase family serine peptidase [Temperatibacter marinus]WND01508.1 prolyl oligopeptidase family serine peptidase [Temperatibacter marinus]